MVKVKEVIEYHYPTFKMSINQNIDSSLFDYSFSSKDLIDFSSSNICTSIFWAAEEGVLKTSTVTSLILKMSFANLATSLGWNFKGSFWSVLNSGFNFLGLKLGFRFLKSVFVYL